MNNEVEFKNIGDHLLFHKEAKAVYNHEHSCYNSF